MGRRVERLLRAALPGARVLAASRSAGSDRRLDLRDPSSFAPALRGVSVLVNAVGPYAYDPAPLVRACIEARVHVVDLADDLRWLERTEAAAQESAAARNGVAVVPGCSTVPGLVSVLASRWAARTDVATISAFLSMGSANPPSRGLLAGLLAPLGRARPDGGRWFTSLVTAKISDGRVLPFGAWPAPVVAGGLPLGGRRVPLRFCVGFDRTWVTWALRLVAPLVGCLPQRWIPGVASLALPFARAARTFGTPRGVLLLRAEDTSGREVDRIELAAEANGLDIPAAPAVWAVARLLSAPPAAAGCVGLEQLVARDDAIRWLQGAGFAVRDGG